MSLELTRSSGRQRIRLVQVLTRHQLAILAYSRAITGQAQLAEDVYQEVAVILAEDPSRIPQADAEVWIWLREVTRRKALEVRRRGNRALHLSEAVIESLGPSFVEPADDQLIALREAMGHCVDKLAGDARVIVEGRYCHNWTCDDIASRVGRTVQAVYAVLKRTRILLQQCVEQRVPSDQR
jgi:RNA polymerase sigma factor (sigma-70 family)